MECVHYISRMEGRPGFQHDSLSPHHKSPEAGTGDSHICCPTPPPEANEGAYTLTTLQPLGISREALADTTHYTALDDAPPSGHSQCNSPFSESSAPSLEGAGSPEPFCETQSTTSGGEGSFRSKHVLPPCRVCGAQAKGFHYGANTCEACKVN